MDNTQDAADAIVLETQPVALVRVHCSKQVKKRENGFILKLLQGELNEKSLATVSHKATATGFTFIPESETGAGWRGRTYLSS